MTFGEGIGLVLGIAALMLLVAAIWVSVRDRDGVDAYLRRVEHTCNDRCRFEGAHYVTEDGSPKWVTE